MASCLVLAFAVLCSCLVLVHMACSFLSISTCNIENKNLIHSVVHVADSTYKMQFFVCLECSRRSLNKNKNKNDNKYKDARLQNNSFILHRIQLTALQDFDENVYFQGQLFHPQENGTRPLESSNLSILMFIFHLWDLSQ